VEGRKSGRMEEWKGVGDHSVLIWATF